jgi:ABC-2 type transport system ATP-binding protein
MSEHNNAVLPARTPAKPHSGGEVALEVCDLVKTYPGPRGGVPVRALDQLSIRVAAGTIFGLLGPNGAGKSTTVKILTTLSRPDSGDAHVAGIDVVRHPGQVRREIGLVSQKASSDPMATGRENLLLAARIQGLSRRAAATRAGELLDRFGLTDAANRLVRTYSGGMARRLDVAIGLVHRPQVLFLDEPTTGLDPEARAEMWAEIERLADERTTVLLTTHYLDEADRLADRLAIVDHGRVVVEGTAEDLKRELRGDAIVVELGTAAQMAAAVTRLGRVPGLREISSDGGSSLRARADHGATAVPAVLASLDGTGVTVASVTVSRPSLDDVYLRHAGRTYHATEENSR